MILKKISLFLFTLLVSVGTPLNVRSGEVSVFSDVYPNLAKGQLVADDRVVHSDQRIAQGVKNGQVAGKWESNWGLVVFNSDLTGYWNQADGTGKILDGSYNPISRMLTFRYYQPWNNKNGTAMLILSNDGNSLSGQWTQGTGLFDSGSWTMTRTSSNASSTTFTMPFKPNCAAMQQYFNSIKWNPSNRFQGFEGMKFSKFVDAAYCNGGYITETSPMGTQICRGNMQILWTLRGEPRFSWGYGNFASKSRQGDSCRWKQ